MAVHVLTTDGQYTHIANDPAGFKIDTSVPFPSFFKVTCENEQIFWFNAAHVIAVGQFPLLEEDGQSTAISELNS